MNESTDQRKRIMVVEGKIICSSEHGMRCAWNFHVSSVKESAVHWVWYLRLTESRKDFQPIELK